MFENTVQIRFNQIWVNLSRVDRSVGLLALCEVASRRVSEGGMAGLCRLVDWGEDSDF